MFFLSKLKALDAYPKHHEDLKVRTYSGAIVSIIALFCIVSLFISELSFYMTTETIDHLQVDVSRGEKLQINFDVTFPHIPCSILSLDAMDVSGSHQLDISHNIKKKPLDKNLQPIGQEVIHELGHTMTEHDITKPKENTTVLNATNSQEKKIDPTKQPGYCGSCYGAESRMGQCCNSCDDVRVAYRTKGWALTDLKTVEQCISSGETQDTLLFEMERGDGCEMYGYLQVNKVAGNFHFAPGKSFQHAHMHVHDLASFSATIFNVSHIINSLSFGQLYPGIVNPLDNTKKTISEGGGMYMYYVKIVPTSYSYLNGNMINTNQFSVTEHFRKMNPQQGQGLPGVFFFYELSPIMVRFTETRKSLAHFLTQLCAILGGVFTVAGMVDRVVYHGIRQIEKKMEMGKIS